MEKERLKQNRMSQKLQKIKINVTYEATTREYELDKSLPIETHLTKICEVLNLIFDKDKWALFIPSLEEYVRASHLVDMEKGAEIRVKLHPKVEAQQIISSFTNENDGEIKKSLYKLQKTHLKVFLFSSTFSLYFWETKNQKYPIKLFKNRTSHSCKSFLKWMERKS